MDSSQPNQLDQLAEEFAARLRAGENPSIDEYAVRYQGLADQIRGLFPALMALEELAGTDESAEETARLKNRVREFLPISEEERVDELCDQFEAAHRSGQQPRIEDYLVRGADVAQDRLLAELIALELNLQHQAGTLSELESYLRRFPDRRAVVEAAGKLADRRRSSDGNAHPTEWQRETADHKLPERFGRYVVEKELGRGGFAVVYLAHDTELERQVALKVPRGDRFRTGGDIERFLDEARNAASLHHPGIVGVHDVQRQGDSVYIVQQYVPGQDLATVAKHRRCSPREVAELMVGIAAAVGFAHQAGLYHRDLKLANILIDEDGKPFVADFGLAMHVSRQREHRGELAGSYPYMAPEQVRGEAHRIDERTDIWALGVMLYELLSGTRPFQGQDRAQLVDKIEYADPRPPRQIDPSVPRELSRVSLACLAKRAADRYESTADLIDDLQHWLDGEAATQLITDSGQHLQIIPKGLRSFDAADADFFLELLPGPRDRDGLPGSIRFWKQRIEEMGAGATFSVGLIYGPSGCGKSSLVQAGLLPRLAEHIVPVYVEATAADTEVRLLKCLRRRCPELPAEGSLVELLIALRDHGTAGGKKVLIVLDQFEQWLHAHNADAQNQLVDALRHCDGDHVQAIVLVRDDFYRGVNRFFQALEERLLERHNQALVDLFDLDHATKVLIAFGRAYGKLPHDQLTSEQMTFIETAVNGLAEEGEVVSVRLAVFAEMMKGKSWTPASLRDVGGTEGVGVTFLDETFAARTAPPNYRLHEKGVRAVLQALLPEMGTEIKGQMLPYLQLLSASGYEGRPADFDALLDILDGEVRLITPTEPDVGVGEDDQVTEQAAKHYQLSHDYLVPSLRRWLRQKETESYAGRARLRLAERAALYQNKPEIQQLPRWWDYLNILALTRKRDWTAPQRRMMSAARSYYTTRAAAVVVFVALLAWGGREMFVRFKSTELVNSLIKAGEDNVLETVNDLQPYLPWATDGLEALAALEPKTVDEIRQQLHARLALVATDKTQVPPLVESLLKASPKYLGVIRKALHPYREQIGEELWSEFQEENNSVNRRFRAGLALANYAADSSQWQNADYRFLAERLVSSNPEHQPILRENLQPISDRCLPCLEELFESAESAEMQISAANAMADFAGNDQARIARLLTVANQKQYEILFPLIALSPEESVITSLAKRAAELPADDLSLVDRVPFGQRRAGAGVTLLRLGERESVLPTFNMMDDPEALTQFIHRCHERDVRAEELLECLRLAARSSLDPRTSSLTRYALMLSLAEYSLNDIAATDRESLLAELADWYAHDPSSGVHGATGWLLRQWGQDEIVKTVDQTPVPYSPQSEWFTLAVTVKSPRPDRISETAKTESEATETEEATQSSDGESTASSKGRTNEASDDDEDTTSPDKTTATSEEHEEGSSAGTEEASETPEASDAVVQTEQESEFVPQTFYFTFIVFPPGEYQIGSTIDEPKRLINETQHAVRITRLFAVLDRELTFAELIAFDQRYRGFMGDQANLADAAFGPDWYDAVDFCRWLTEQADLSEEDQSYPDPASVDAKQSPREPSQVANWAPLNWPVQLDRHGFRLPTEAEWEVACRAGMRSMYGQGSDAGLLRHFAWSVENAERSVHPPKMRRPGLQGLFDMHGNLWEWCHDWDGDYPSDTVVDGSGPETGLYRVMRGGGFGRSTSECRASRRSSLNPTGRQSSIGFRLALVPSTPPGD